MKLQRRTLSGNNECQFWRTPGRTTPLTTSQTSSRTKIMKIRRATIITSRMNPRSNLFTKLSWMPQVFSRIRSCCLVGKPKLERTGLAFSMMLGRAAKRNQITKLTIKELMKMDQRTEKRQRDKRVFSAAAICW